MENGFVCLSFLSGSAVSIAFDLTKDIFTGFEGINAFFDSCHGIRGL